MQRAFVVRLELDPLASVDGIADDLREAIESEGYTVLGIQPWSAQTEQTLTGLNAPLTNVDIPTSSNVPEL